MKDILQGIIYFGLFAVPVLTLYVANDYFFPYITGKNFWFRIIVEVIFGAYLLLALLDSKFRPKISGILLTFTGLIAVMAVATLNAEHITTALWSNFERMDGYITLLHVFLYFLVMGSMFKTEKVWVYFMHATVAVATLVALKGVAQLSGTATRVDSTLGNAAYMAVYMLFHIFFLAWLFVRTKVVPYRVVYALIMSLFVFVLLQTGTRGTAIGLATGSLAAVVYMVLFATKHPHVRRVALGSIAGLIVLFGGFYALRDTNYVQETPALARIANIDLGNDLRIRSIIWGMSVEGIKERPMLGWGNGNFNYVFNSQYDPKLYAQEQWFDRVHNIFFDWLIAGGVFGFVAYMSLFVSLFYYLVIKAWKDEGNMSVVERGILFGLIIGYFTHNLVVFDNIISYIFFAVLLAYLHSRYSHTWVAVEKIKIPTPILNQIVAPFVVVLVMVTVYFVNVPSMKAASGIIDAFKTQDYGQRLELFEKVIALNSFAEQEIVEQLAQQAMAVAQAGSTVDPVVKEKFLAVTEKHLQDLAQKKPGDARLHVFLSSYYRSIGNNAKAREELVNARKFSPKKQAIILQQGAVALAEGDKTGALSFFKDAYELDTTNSEAKQYYIAALYYNGDKSTAQTLLNESTQEFVDSLATNDFLFNALNDAKDYEQLASLYEKRVLIEGDNAQNWASLAFVYYQLSQNASTTDRDRQKVMISKAIETLDRGAKTVPSFAATAQCVTKNLKSGAAPEVGCR